MLFCTLNILYFCVNSGVRPRPKLHKTDSSGLAIITLTILEIELFTNLNSFADAVKTQKLNRVPFLLELVAVVSKCII